MSNRQALPLGYAVDRSRYSPVFTAICPGCIEDSRGYLNPVEAGPDAQAVHLQTIELRQAVIVWDGGRQSAYWYEGSCTKCGRLYATSKTDRSGAELAADKEQE